MNSLRSQLVQFLTQQLKYDQKQYLQQLNLEFITKNATLERQQRKNHYFAHIEQLKTRLREQHNQEEASLDEQVSSNLENYKTEQYKLCKQRMQLSGKKIVGLYGIISDSVMRNYKLYVNQLRDSQPNADNSILAALQDKHSIASRLANHQKYRQERIDSHQQILQLKRMKEIIFINLKAN